MTLIVTAISVFFGTILGIVFGVLPLSGRPVVGRAVDLRPRRLPLDPAADPAGPGQCLHHHGAWAAGISGFTVACGVLSLYTAAYCAEIVRGGIEAVPHDAAPRRALAGHDLGAGHDGSIVLPLATRVALPSWIGLALGVMKDSALVYIVQVVELLEIHADPDHAPARAAVPADDLRSVLLPHFLPDRPVRRVSGKTVVQ